MAIFDPQSYYTVTVKKDIDSENGAKLKKGDSVKIAVLGAGDFLSVFNYPFFFDVYGSQIKYEFLKQHNVDISEVWKEAKDSFEIKKVGNK